MSRLGYERYGAQGGDVGAGVSPELGRLDPARVVGVHVNAATVGFMPFPPLDEDEMAELTDDEKTRVDMINYFMNEQFGYNALQSTRPQIIAYGLTDSPVGQLSPGSSRSSRGGLTPRTCQRTLSTATRCSPTSCCTG